MSDLSLREYLRARGANPNQGVRSIVAGVPRISLRSLLTPVILETDFPAPAERPMPVKTERDAPTWLRDEKPVWQWTPMVDPHDEFDTPGTNLVGVSGTAVWCKTSDSDVPFTHPFVPPKMHSPTGYDWECFLALDPKYESVLAPSNTGVNPANGNVDDDYHKANEYAHGLGFSAPKGVLGVEIDQFLVPERYQAMQKDRVAIFGRWIVDTGHDDFHTEIHPPLLLACARPSEGQTNSTVVARPYLVSQEFGDGALRQHLINEFKKLLPRGFPPHTESHRVEAHPHMMPKPFSGNPMMSYIVRPPSPRRNQNQKLTLSFHFTVRSGVKVTLSSAEPYGVRISVAMDSTSFIPTSPHNRQNWDVSLDDMDQLCKLRGTGLGTWIKDALFAEVLATGGIGIYLAIEVGRGIRTDTYDPPVAASSHDSEVTTVAVDSVGQGPHYSVDDSQPFPIYGWLNVGWDNVSPSETPARRLPSPPASGVLGPRIGPRQNVP